MKREQAVRFVLWRYAEYNARKDKDGMESEIARWALFDALDELAKLYPAVKSGEESVK